MRRTPFDHITWALALRGWLAAVLMVSALLLGGRYVGGDTQPLAIAPEACWAAYRSEPADRLPAGASAGEQAASSSRKPRLEAPSKSQKAQRWTPFPFDPNTLDSAGFVRLGFSPRQARGIIRYRAKGGYFRGKADFQRLRLVSGAAYEALAAHIAIDSSHWARPGEASRFRPFPFDPNTLDSAGFVRLGFSPRQARGIIRYRAKGGYFRDKADFQRVYVVDSSAFLLLAPYITLEP